MADDEYLTNPNQPPAALAPLGSSGLAALAGGQLVVVPAIVESDSNWYYDLFGPSYDDYYTWSPTPSGQSPAPQPPATPPAPSGGTVIVTGGIMPAGSSSTPSGGAGATPPPSSSSVPGGSSTPPDSGVASGSAPGAAGGSPPVAASGSAPVAAAPLTPIAAAPSVPAPAAPSPSAVTVVIAPYPMPSIAPAASSAPAPAAVSAPTPVADDPPNAEEALAPSAPSEKTLTAVGYNPRFRESRARGQEALLQELLDEENLTIRMHAKESAPLAFVVPDGCDSVEFSYGPIAINSELGCDDDLAQVVTVGEAQLQGEDGKRLGVFVEGGSLMAGAPLLVTIPWRAASHVNLNANHLMVTVYAHFYALAERRFGAP